MSWITGRRATSALLALVLIMGGANLLATYLQVHASQAALQRSAHASQVAQRKAGQVLGEKLCTTFGKLAALQPPPGSAAANPSRAFLQNLHATLDELGTDLGCRRGA